MSKKISVSDAVAVLLDQGPDIHPRWKVGSGFLIGGTQVLTAAHNVAGEGKLFVQRKGPEKYTATIVQMGNVDQGLDLAIIKVTDPRFRDAPVANVQFATLNRNYPDRLPECFALGFPRFKARKLPPPQDGWLREYSQIDGYIPLASNVKSGMLELHVTVTPQASLALGSSEWEGMSGAVVFVRDPDQGDYAIGVLVEHYPAEGLSSLTAVPITAISDKLDEPTARQWWELLGVRDSHELPYLPLDPERELVAAEETYRRQVGIQSNSGGDIKIEQSQVNIAGGNQYILYPPRFSRRTVVAGLCVLTILGAGGGGLTWLAYNHSSGLVATPTSTNVPMFGFDPQRTHFNPHEQILSVKNVSRLVRYWTTPPIGAMWGSSPVVANGLVYVTGNSGYLYTFHTSTGEAAWNKSIPDSPVSNPTVANDLVYVGSDGGNLYAFNASTGALAWRARVSSSSQVRCSPAVVNGNIYVGSVDGNLYALSASTGASVWNKPAITGGIMNSSPAVSDGIVYVGSIDGKLYAFSASTGAPVWPAPASLGSPIGSTPAVANDLVYIATDYNKLYAFSASTGASVWNKLLGRSTSSGPVVSSPAVANGVVYIGSGDQQLYAFNAFTGASFWSAATGSAILSSPTVANGVVYVGSDDGKLYAFNGDGELLRSYAIDGAIFSSPIVAEGVVYVCSVDGVLSTFHLPSTTP